MTINSCQIWLKINKSRSELIRSSGYRAPIRAFPRTGKRETGDVDRVLEISQNFMSGNLVPLTIIKGAGHEFIPLPNGENATTADFHSIRTKTESPAHFTSGFYKIEAGPQRPAHYTFEETKYVLNGQIDILDEATGITHHLVPGDFAFFHVGSKVKFSTKFEGLAFYAVTRPVRTPHPNLLGREEDSKAKL
ncbi:hypothetical protein N7478_013117 [Penicillium angulare]|uniref:uncharacterized protein n=1 Tax=Penicillium angulare TaxID=116970 RepID=UPI002540488D|nr:uncharacterized protein N7478_013117 [Penicillium angulare]KAJ5257013.1 hypothetical protein N7478_013117 [Penicillium angulare]